MARLIFPEFENPITTLAPRRKPPYPDSYLHRNIDPNIFQENMRQASQRGLSLQTKDAGEMTLSHWSDLLQREDAVEEADRTVLSKLSGKFQDFNMGNFAELRVWHVLDELFRQGLTDDYSTKAYAPFVKEPELRKNYAFNIDFDSRGFDAFASVKDPNGKGYLISPLQIKSGGDAKAIEKHTTIPRELLLRAEQVDYLVEKFPYLKNGYFCKVPKEGHNKVTVARMEFKTHPTCLVVEGKKRSQLKQEILDSFTDADTTLVKSKKPLSKLSKLRLIKLLIRSGVFVPSPIQKGDIEYFSADDAPKKLRPVRANQKPSASQRKRLWAQKQAAASESEATVASPHFTVEQASSGVHPQQSDKPQARKEKVG